MYEESSPYCLDTDCYQYNECGHRMTIKSEYACVLGAGSKYDSMVKKKLFQIIKHDFLK